MRRYRFRLEAVLRVRRLQEDVARGALLEATAAAGRAEAAVVRAQAWLDDLRQAPGRSGAIEWEAQRRVQLAAADELAAHRSQLVEARREQRARQAALAEARSRVR